MTVIQNKASSVLEEMRSYIEKFIKTVDSSKAYHNSKSFVEGNFEKKDIDIVSVNGGCKKCEINREKIEINTVHSAKGETHTATLYLESRNTGGKDIVTLFPHGPLMSNS